MTLRTTTQYLIRNERTGTTHPGRWLSVQAARQAALAMMRTDPRGFWKIYTELLVEQPEADRV